MVASPGFEPGCPKALRPERSASASSATRPWLYPGFNPGDCGLYPGFGWSSGRYSCCGAWCDRGRPSGCGSLHDGEGICRRIEPSCGGDATKSWGSRQARVLGCRSCLALQCCYDMTTSRCWTNAVRPIFYQGPGWNARMVAPDGFEPPTAYS